MRPSLGVSCMARLLEVHAVLLGEAFDLAVAEHGQAGQRGHQGADAEVLVAVAELVDRGALVGVGHEVDVALEDLGVELDGLLEVAAVLGVLLVAQHVHEGGVVDAVHAERADEVAFHHPEGFGEEQRAGDFDGDAVDDLAPELDGHERVELFLRHRVFGARRDGAAAAGQREPEPLDVALGERHRRVEADDREQARDVEDGLDDVLADLGLRVVELRGVVPGMLVPSLPW